MRKVQKISITPAKLISTNWQLEVQHSGHMWVQCLPMGTKWQCMPMGMKVQHSGHMSAMRLKFPFSMFQRLNQHRSHGPIFYQWFLGNYIIAKCFSLLKKSFCNVFFLFLEDASDTGVWPGIQSQVGSLWNPFVNDAIFFQFERIFSSKYN